MLRRSLLKTPLGVAVAASPVASVLAQAAGASPVPLEDFFRHSRFSSVRLSPSGRYLGAIAPVNGRLNLAIVDLETRASQAITSLSDKDIRSFWWVNDNRLVFTLIDLQRAMGEQVGAGLFAVDRDGTNGRELSPVSPFSGGGTAITFRYAQFLRTIDAAGSGGTDEILVLANDREFESPDVYRMDTRTGRKTLLTFDRPANVTGWTLDRTNVPRAAVVDERESKYSVWFRDDDKAAWRKLGTYDALANEADSFAPVAFDRDGSLIVSARAGQDRAALFFYDTKANKLAEQIVAHPMYDVDGQLRFDHRTQELVGVWVQADKPDAAWFSTEWAGWQKAMDQALPGRVNVLDGAPRGGRMLVTSYSDRDPASFYLFDTRQGKLEKVAAARPWTDPSRMASSRFLRYQARDGMSIPAYLTLPPGVEAKGLPLVVLVHGGPWVRGQAWGFDPEAQFLASRGYAVLQPDFRGSLGYGWRHYRSAWKQWGQSMQDDLNDGAEHLVREGIVDRSRMCIAGGSYGGYAVMAGLARDPEFWRCGVNWVGVTDLDLLQTATWSDMASLKDLDQLLGTLIGSRTEDRAQLDRTSPVRNAQRIKRPVMMVYGGLDLRVPIQHGDRMRDALQSAGATFEYIVYKDEGHGFMLERNRFDFYRRMERFLAQHMA